MSPIGKYILENCDNDMRLSVKEPLGFAFPLDQIAIHCFHLGVSLKS